MLARSAEAAAEGPPDGSAAGLKRAVGIALVGGIAAALAGMYAYAGSIAGVRQLLSQSGFSAAFALIFVSEIGDKTFFIAALLAMEFGRWLSFLGTMSSLTLMTVISVGIGVLFRNVPEALKTSAPVGEWLSVAMLLWFGIRTLQAGLASKVEDGEEDGGELGEAQETVEQRRAKLVSGNKSTWTIFAEVASLIFVAEWGDRSMLATVALGAAQSPVGVTLGAVGGHALATVLAVLGGSLISRYISERMISIIGGALFLVFAAATAVGLF